MTAVLVGVLGYIAVQFAIGAWVSRRIRTESDYINAGRRIGPVLGAFTVFATWFGAEAVVGTAGQVYENGLAGAGADPFGYALALVVAGVFFAATLWRRGLVTFADLFRQRFGPGVEKLVVIALLPGSVFWAAAQIRAFGQVLSSVSDLDVALAITFATTVVVAYTVLGGLMADAVTDLVQGVAVIVGLVVLGVLAAGAGGGLAASLAAVPAPRLALLDAPFLAMVERFAVPVCGTIVAVELVSRMLGCRSAETARGATVAGGALYLAVGLIPVYLGLVGPQLVPGLTSETAEQLVPELAARLLPGIAFVLFAGALISAILSTVDSVLLASAAQISHNVLLRLAPATSEAAKVRSARLSVVALAALASLLAATAASIRELVEVASAAGSPGILVALVFGLNTRLGGSVSAAAAIVAGSGVWAVGHFAGLTETPYVTALGAAVIAYIAGAAWHRPQQSAGGGRRRPAAELAPSVNANGATQ